MCGGRASRWLLHLLQCIASTMLLPGELGQGDDRLAFGLVAIPTNSAGRTDSPPFPQQHPVAEQGRQRAEQIEAMLVGVRDRVGQPNVVGKQTELQGLGSRRGHIGSPSTISGGWREDFTSI